MGWGSWTSASYNTAVRTMGFSSTTAMASANVQEVYRENRLNPLLNPKNVVRECLDTEEHPETIPVILALDVTGSMGSAATMCASKLDEIMQELYNKVKDVEFLMMGIGDLACDDAPIQASQFESDIRILDQTTKVYFEGGGGGNAYESYTAAWYFGLHNTKLDCWKRGKKGIIITMGDEPLNPYLPGRRLSEVLGTSTQDVDTEILYKEVCEKYDVYHIAITNNSCYNRYRDEIKNSWGKLLNQHLIIATSDELPKIISEIVAEHENNYSNAITVTEEGISW
mgnify:CR=1 FL=1